MAAESALIQRDDAGGEPPASLFERAMLRLAEGLAVGGGLLMLGVGVMVVVSVLRRWIFGQSVPGDFELVQTACGIAVFWFQPYCQVRNGHVMVDFFTANAPARVRAGLDMLSHVMFTAVAALICWRMWYAVTDSARAGTTTMVLQVPLIYGVALAYLGAIALVGTSIAATLRSARVFRRGR